MGSFDGSKAMIILISDQQPPIQPFARVLYSDNFIGSLKYKNSIFISKIMKSHEQLSKPTAKNKKRIN